jgi:hypothetical protein
MFPRFRFFRNQCEGAGIAGRVTQAETGSGPPSVEGGCSRDPVVMEETLARSAPYQFETGHSRVVANIVRALYIHVINPYVL